MSNDNLNIPDLYRLLQDFFRISQENMALRQEKLDAELRHMYAEYQLRLTEDLLAKLKEIHFGDSVQNGAARRDE